MSCAGCMKPENPGDNDDCKELEDEDVRPGDPVGLPSHEHPPKWVVYHSLNGKQAGKFTGVHPGKKNPSKIRCKVKGETYSKKNKNHYDKYLEILKAREAAGVARKTVDKEIEKGKVDWDGKFDFVLSAPPKPSVNDPQGRSEKLVTFVEFRTASNKRKRKKKRKMKSKRRRKSKLRKSKKRRKSNKRTRRK
tara:strand:- start:3103 stop:3678 length:576 start_codon:yes stop_codon:yes gene_type:complete